MQRRTVLQIIAAFFASFFGKFRRFGELGPIARLRGAPVGPRGKVSPKAAWFSPPKYESVQTHSAEQHTELLERLREGATLPPPTLPLLKKGEFRPFIFRVDHRYRPDRQEGYEVMLLKNPAIQPSVVMGMGFPNGRPEGYVTPTRPIAVSGGAWTPLKEFLPLQHHPDLPAMGVLVGTMAHPALAPRFDISNDTEFKVITHKRRLDPTIGPVEGDQHFTAEARARINANHQELFDNWGQPSNPDDVAQAHEATASVREQYTQQQIFERGGQLTSLKS